MTISCEYTKFFNFQKSFSFLSNAPHIIKQKFEEIENTVRVPSRMKLTENLVFLHYFSKFMGILFFVLNYMYISLLLKMINGFSWPSKIMASPFKTLSQNQIVCLFVCFHHLKADTFSIKMTPKLLKLDVRLQCYDQICTRPHSYYEKHGFEKISCKVTELIVKSHDFDVGTWLSRSNTP